MATAAPRGGAPSTPVTLTVRSKGTGVAVAVGLIGNAGDVPASLTVS